VTVILNILLLSLILTAVGFLAWWLLIATEGVYLGRRVVIWLYDLYAHRYQAVKGYRREYEHMFLAQPLMGRISPFKAPLVLDVATGTGRLPLALARHAHFEGHVIGLDLSRRMLHHATQCVYPYNDRMTFICAPAEALPFDDDTFDIVTCLEALEFMVYPEAVLQELVRVLRPGGTLLVTQRINTRWMPGKTWGAADIHALFAVYGIEDGEVQIWQVDYRKIWGRKRGAAAPMGVQPLAKLLRCPRCHQKRMQANEKGWACGNCGRPVRVGADGVVEWANAGR
jgi:SAM-dependent methyltransferase